MSCQYPDNCVYSLGAVHARCNLISWVLDAVGLVRQDLFDPNEAQGRHHCDLDDPYGRMVAWNLVEMAWEQDAENWEGEQLDGQPWNLEEPPPGEVWTREDFALPDTGLLTLNFRNTMRVPRYDDVVEWQFMSRLMEMMEEMSPANAVRLLKLAAMDFYFTAEYAGLLLQMLQDGMSRVDALAALMPRIVDYCNITYHCYDLLTDFEMQELQSCVGQLMHFTPNNPVRINPRCATESLFVWCD